MHTKNKSAFSLIEVMLAILILALASGVIFRSAGGIQDQAYKTVARDNVRKVQESYDQWLSSQPSIEAARRAFNPSKYTSSGATSIDASYPDPSLVPSHLSPFLNSETVSQMTQRDSNPGQFLTDSLVEAGGYMTIFWDPDYRNSNIKVIITLP